jgi:hypothetical protein
VISAADAQQYLDQTLGVTVPGFLLRAAVESVEALEPAMLAAGYDEPTQIRIQAMAVAIVAAAGSPRRLASQGAPSGASRSFKYADKDMTALRRSLAALDTAGTTAQLIGPDPSTQTLLMVV